MVSPPRRGSWPAPRGLARRRTPMAKQILDLCALVSTKGRKSSSVGKLASAKMACAIVAFCFATAIAASAQTFNVVYNFDNGPNDPHDNSTVQGRDGYMYSTTPQVWSGQSGDVFKIDPAGPSGTTVVITGDSFTGATEVVFACGEKAIFTVDSDTQITATVPAAAMTGAISVVTPGGNVGSPIFTVPPCSCKGARKELQRRLPRGAFSAAEFCHRFQVFSWPLET